MQTPLSLSPELISEESWRQPVTVLGSPIEATIDATVEATVFPKMNLDVLWVSTSGTTGQPKWVALPKSGVEISAHQVQSFLRDHLRLTDTEYQKLNWGLAIFPSKIGGFSVSLRAHLWNQQCQVWGQPWSPKGFALWCEKSQINLVSLVPTQVFDLVNLGLRPPVSLRAVLVGGDRLSATLFERALDLGWPILCTYAMTELSSTIAIQKEPSAPFEVLPHVEALQAEDDFLAFKSEALFLGECVFNSGSAPQFIPAKKNDLGFWVSEDRGHYQGGNLSLLGRSSDWVKILGVGVAITKVREEFESKLLQASLPNTQLGILVYQKTHLTHRPCARKGRQLVLWVENELPDEAQKMIAATLADWNQTHAKPLSIEIEPVERLRRGPSGKIFTP